MWSNPQFPADLATFTEEILNGKLHFLCSVTFYANKNTVLFRFSEKFFHQTKRFEIEMIRVLKNRDQISVNFVIFVFNQVFLLFNVPITKLQSLECFFRTTVCLVYIFLAGMQGLSHTLWFQGFLKRMLKLILVSCKLN